MLTGQELLDALSALPTDQLKKPLFFSYGTDDLSDADVITADAVSVGALLEFRNGFSPDQVNGLEDDSLVVALTESGTSEAYSSGVMAAMWTARRDGVKNGTNPYNEGTTEHDDWQRGYDNAKPVLRQQPQQDSPAPTKAELMAHLFASDAPSGVAVLVIEAEPSDDFDNTGLQIERVTYDIGNPPADGELGVLYLHVRGMEQRLQKPMS